MLRMSFRTIRFLCAIVVVVVCVFEVWQLNPFIRTPRPIQWSTYTDETKSAGIEDGKVVIVFAYPLLSPSSEMALKNLDTLKIEKLLDQQAYVPLKLEYEDWNGSAIRELLQNFGHTKEPFIVVYQPDEAPVALNPFSLEPRQ